MQSNTATLIEAWFTEHNQDGEFVWDGRAVPYSIVGPSSHVERMVLTTKPLIVSIAIGKASERVGMIGRYGLPQVSDLSWIRSIVGQRPLLFLGDMDPVDLMVFAWLRIHLLSRAIVVSWNKRRISRLS